MLSILIPAYQQDIRELVVDLHHQASKINKDFEIIVCDDGSDPKLLINYQILERISHVHILYNQQNIGRSRTRNRLIKTAIYDHLLILDGDSRIISKQFILTYLQAIENQPGEFMHGGRIYPSYYRQDECLHWTVGKKKEELSAQERSQRKHLAFNSNNYAAPRELHVKYLYDETIDTYGYEDLELACRLASQMEGISHIDNPVLHQELKSHDQLLSDLRNAMRNLSILSEAKPYINTPVINTFEKLKKYRSDRIFIGLFSSIAKAMNTNSLKCQISAYLIDVYKIYYFALNKK